MVILRKSKSPLDRSKRHMNFLTSPELQTQDAIITVTCSHQPELWNGSIQTHYGQDLNFDFCHIRIKQSYSFCLLNSFAIRWRVTEDFLMSLNTKLFQQNLREKYPSGDFSSLLQIDAFYYLNLWPFLKKYKRYIEIIQIEYDMRNSCVLLEYAV